MNGTSNKAILQSEGTQEYRGCKIVYFTFSMSNTLGAVSNKPHTYRVNVNVHLQIFMNDCIKTLPLDESFNSEKEAIDHAIIEGKKYVDYLYSIDKISEVKAIPSSKINVNYGRSAAIAKPKKKSQRNGNT